MQPIFMLSADFPTLSAPSSPSCVVDVISPTTYCGPASPRPKAPLSGADSPYQGEMSRRDKRGRDAVSRRLTERFYQICRNLSVSAHAEPPPLEGEAFLPAKINFPKSLPFSHRHVIMAQRPSATQRDIPLFCLLADRICRLKGKTP